MKAVVVVSRQTGEPEALVKAAGLKLTGDEKVELADLRIASEWALSVAVATLQGIAVSSGCPRSRANAMKALEGVAFSNDIPSDPTGRPKSIILEPHQRLDSLNLVGNPYLMWE